MVRRTSKTCAWSNPSLVAAGLPFAVALSSRDRGLTATHVESSSCRPGTASRQVIVGGRREAHIPTKHPPTCQEARVPLSDEHPSWPSRPQEPSRQGPRPPVGLILRVRDRQAFERLATRGSRIRRTALWCTWCHEPESTGTSVAFAFGRAFGPAVARNRIRRRLRAILRDLDGCSPLPPGLLLVGGKAELIELTFDQLRIETSALLDEVRRRVAGNA